MSKADTRNILEKAAWGALRQGMFFNGVRIDGYEACEVYGMIITAHCDLVQDKTPVINFVPVVSLSDWLLRDGARLLAKRNRAEFEGRVKSLLKRAGLSLSLLTVHSIEEIIQVHLATQKAKKGVSPQDEAKLLRDGIALCDAVQNVGLATRADVDNLIAKGAAIYDRLLVECMTQKLMGYYFLAGVDPDASQSGYVALLRQIYHLPANLAQAVANGIDQSMLSQLSAVQPSASPVLSTGAEFIMPVSQLRSPYLEHMMQAFGMLYMRIGVPDLASVYMDAVNTAHRGVKP